MFRLLVTRSIGVFLCLLFSVFCLPAVAATTEPMKIVVGTSLIEDIVSDLTGERAKLLTLVPGSSCPGHEDMKAADVIFAAQAQLALVHGFQQRIPAFSHLVRAAESHKLRIETLVIPGNWMAPPVQREAVERIAALLTEVYPNEANAIAARKAKRLARLNAAQQAAQQKLQPLAGKTVIAARMQADFLQWAGLKVAVAYSSLDEITPNEMVRVLRTTRGTPLIGVVDNLQSGADTGRPLADELHIEHITLSNFPGSSAAVPDYFSLLNRNVETLLSLLTPQQWAAR